MSALIQKVTIIDPHSPYNGKKLDMLISKGRIEAIGSNIDQKAEKVINGQDWQVSPGWVDVLCDYGEPGYEDKETIDSGLHAAAAGGFTDVFLLPNTQPAIATHSLVAFARKKAAGHRTNLHVIGAVSKNIEGKELAEMIDMQHSGAIAFSDGWQPVQDAGLMVKALEYVKIFKGIVIQIPLEAALSKGGLMNESETSLRLGMSGIPAMAESLIVYRDLELLRYSGSRIHFSGITTPAALKLIKAAKKEGLAVTCSVTPYHLLFSDECLEEYDSMYKVAPPLRTEKERKALISALKEGLIDCIATHHRPQDQDAKTREFEYAGSGMIGQETCWPMLLQAIPDLPLERWVELLSLNPRKIFGLPIPAIEENQPARLTLFNTTTPWTYSSEQKQSKAINSPWLGQQLTGRAVVL